jgi:hypothetical protein
MLPLYSLYSHTHSLSSRALSKSRTATLVPQFSQWFRIQVRSAATNLITRFAHLPRTHCASSAPPPAAASPLQSSTRATVGAAAPSLPQPSRAPTAQRSPRLHQAARTLRDSLAKTAQHPSRRCSLRASPLLHRRSKAPRCRSLDSRPLSLLGAAFASLSQLFSCFSSLCMRFADRWSLLFEGVYGLPLIPCPRQSAASARCSLVFCFKHNWRRLKQASNSCEGNGIHLPVGAGAWAVSPGAAHATSVPAGAISAIWAPGYGPPIYAPPLQAQPAFYPPVAPPQYPFQHPQSVAAAAAFYQPRPHYY